MKIFSTNNYIQIPNTPIEHQPSFKGVPSADKFVSRNLFHFLKRRLRSTKEVANFLRRLTEEEQYVGALPDKWRQKFNKTDLKDKTQQIQRLFSTFAKESYCPESTIIYSLSKQIDALSKGLEGILGEKCEIDFVGSGNFGKVFKINCADEELALKIYHHETNPAITQFFKEHGRTKEIANAIALNDTLKPNQCARFYCGKVTLNDDPSAFMLSQFIKDKYNPDFDKPFRKWSDYRRFKILDPEHGNLRGNKIVDFGAIHYYYSTPAQQDMAKEFSSLINKGDIKAIHQMRKKHINSPDFDGFIKTIIHNYFPYFNVPSWIATIAKEGYFTKNEVLALKALGIDFSHVETYPSHDSESIKTLKKLGFAIKG